MDVGCSGAGWRALDIFLRRRAENSLAIAAQYAADGRADVFWRFQSERDGGGCAAGAWAGTAVGVQWCEGDGATRQKKASCFKRHCTMHRP